MIEIRASALSEFLDCPARAEAKHLLGLRTPTTGRAILGTAVHAATAVYDQSTLAGNGITVDEAAGAAVDTIRKPSEEVLWDGEPTQDEAESIAIALHTRYCDEIAPAQDYAAVEVRCERLEISDIGIALTGTTDRVRRVEDGYGVVDLKTGKSAVGTDGKAKTNGHSFQMGVYELLAASASGLPITAPAQIVGMQTGKTAKGQRVGTGTIERAREALLGDEDSPGVLQAVSRMIQHGTFVGNPRSMMCGERFCPIYQKCRFRR